MGLGKTVQVIALMLDVHREKDHGVSLVVAPTSLAYNWLSELNRFAPDLSVMVLNGSSAQRASQIRHVKEVGDVEVLITSYPLIRRDIDQLTDIPFRLVILDEAQHIKNAGQRGRCGRKAAAGPDTLCPDGYPHGEQCRGIVEPV